MKLCGNSYPTSHFNNGSVSFAVVIFLKSIYFYKRYFKCNLFLVELKELLLSGITKIKMDRFLSVEFKYAYFYFASTIFSITFSDFLFVTQKIITYFNGS